MRLVYYPSLTCSPQHLALIRKIAQGREFVEESYIKSMRLIIIPLQITIS